MPPAFRIVLAVILLLHGVGHGLGLLPLFGKRLSPSHSADSWVLGPMLGESRARLVGAAVWAMVIALFTVAALGAMGLFLPGQWHQIAAAASILSLAGLALFWNALPLLFPNKVGVLIVDLGVLAWVFRGAWG